MASHDYSDFIEEDDYYEDMMSEAEFDELAKTLEEHAKDFGRELKDFFQKFPWLRPNPKNPQSLMQVLAQRDIKEIKEARGDKNWNSFADYIEVKFPEIYEGGTAILDTRLNTMPYHS